MPWTMKGQQPEAFNISSTIQALSNQISNPHHTSYYVTIIAILFCAWFFKPNTKRTRISAPFYKASRIKWMFNADSLIKDSYSKAHSTYQIKSTEGVRVIIPPSLVGQLKGLPEDVLSAKTAVQEAMLSEYTHLSADDHADTLTLLIKTKATRNLARMVPDLKDELEYVLSSEFPTSEDWKPIKLQPFMVRTVSRLSGRAFVGPTLCRSEEWMNVSINFAITAFIAVVKLQFFSPWMRPMAQFLVGELRTIRKDLAKAQKMLQPTIEDRLAKAEQSTDYEKPDDFIQWLSDALPDNEKRNYYIQAKVQLLLSASSIHTTSNLTTDCIYDLAVHQDMQEVLREEALEAFGTDGSGWEEKDSIPKLKKMDSFIKESQRLSGNTTSFIRKVMKSIDLSDGTHLPTGTNILAPLSGVALDERYFPEPEIFDGLRFWRLCQQREAASSESLPQLASPPSSRSSSPSRQQQEQANANGNVPYHFTSIGDTNMDFGLGRHACPGRFFAAHEIKLILAYLLLHYEIKLPDGAKRPKPVSFMMTRAPSQTAEVLFRCRKGT
ncbi:cytochrome P450 [Xylariaceae sp. FL0255]|nr:cytochrome P450 [Xylariaceae sp. FL0255]